MEDDRKDKVFTYNYLENQSYRYLQHLAKSLNLPANYKKIYLIDLLLAKKDKKDYEVNNIIKRVKAERLQVVSARKERPSKQTIAVKSPSITATPKRFEYSPEMRTILSYNPKRSLLRNLSGQSSCDRVLRSYDIRNVKPNYKLMNLKDDVPKEASIKIITNGGFPQMKLTAKCVMKRHRPSILTSNPGLKNQLSLTRELNTIETSSKRRRTLSGIYHLQEMIPRNLTADNVSLRKIDGSLTKINALIQKRNTVVPTQKNNYRNQDINIQEIVKRLEENNDQILQYPNMSSFDVNMNSDSLNEIDLYSIYYHKRTERVRNVDNQRLPNITDAFSQFNNVNKKDLTAPLYVQVSMESERTQNYIYNMPRNNPNTITLETLYNFKTQHTTDAPLLQIATTTNTHCVYSTPTVATAMQQSSTLFTDTSAFTSENRRLEDMAEFLHFSESALRKYSQEHSTPSSQCSQDISTCSIPEMVEDAMDIIRRDGNYMQQIEREGIQCVFCELEGNRNTIEEHIRLMHPSQIMCGSTEWRVSFQLSSLSSGSSYAAVLQRGERGDMFVLQLRCCKDTLWGTLTSLSSDLVQKFGKITIHNKLTGEPFYWDGPVQPLSPNLYENCGIELNLDKLDLLHNSANIKFVNSELISSNSKVIVGQKIINDIAIDVYVNVF